jgi:molybdate transport system permease protein
MRFRRVTILSALAVLIVYGLLIASLFFFFDGSAVLAALSSKRVLFSIQLSLIAATVATGLALLIAVPAAYALSRYRFRGRDAVDAILEFPIIVSPAALGAIILIFFSNPLGQWIQDHSVQFVFAFAGIVLAQFITILGVATRFMKTTFDQVPARYETMACTLGASPTRAFFTICLPLARRGIVASGVLAWAKAIGEFGATIMVAGTMAFRTETLPVAIFMRLSSADIEGTVALIIVLLIIGLGALYAAKFLFRERRAET